MTKVKICGITNLDDALCACKAGADAIGFIFYKKSPRFITPQEVRDIIGALPQNILKVGVFVNSGEDYVKKVQHLCRLDMLQFHGTESAQFCEKFRNYKIIKAIRVRDARSLAGIKDYRVYAFLFDTYSAGKFGGTARTFNWTLLKGLKELGRPIFLSGGLNARNINRALKTVGPEWLDASSSLESSPGKKDHQKIKKFIAAAKKEEVSKKNKTRSNNQKLPSFSF